MAAATAERRGDLGQREPAAQLRGGRQLQHRQRIAAGQVRPEGVQGRRIEGPQGRPQAVELALATPDGRLVRSSQHPDGLGQLAIASDQPMIVAVGSDKVSQHLGVTWIRLGP